MRSRAKLGPWSFATEGRAGGSIKRHPNYDQCESGRGGQREKSQSLAP